MGAYLDTRGLAQISIGICGRCSLKFPSVDLMPDPNSPGLMVCRDDVDDYDPYRLPPRETEVITLEFVRPDEPLDVPVDLLIDAWTAGSLIVLAGSLFYTAGAPAPTVIPIP